jgi:catechol 2,3-dioxygenase-like lactoylglutathione lyase family enzyme
VTPGAAPTEDDRTVGFLVDDLDDARRVLLAAGVAVDEEIATNARFRYLHFRAPDGHLYELLEERG